MRQVTRRTVLKTIGATGVSLTLPAELFAGRSASEETVCLGVIADLHGGLAVDAELRLNAFLEAMKKEKCDALVQLGDFAYPNEQHQSFADRFNAAHSETIHVIGNHEFDFGLKRDDCLKAWGIESAYYARDLGGLRLLVLDGNENGSPSGKGGYPSFIGNEQKNWLAAELRGSEKPILILSHQPLAGVSAIDNASEIQELLAGSRDKIVLCLNGHSHVDSLLQVEGVNYLHVNSASYYWVGGKTRMAYYTDPLYTTVTINPKKLLVTIEGRFSEWSSDSPTQIGYFDREDAPPETIVTPAIRTRQIDVGKDSIQTNACRVDESTTTLLKVMTWNIWGRLNQDSRYTIDQKTARERTVEIIRESGADIVAMIETYGSASDIADALGFDYYTPSEDANLCIFSRYPLIDIEPLDELSAFSFIAATVTLPDGQRIRVYDVWLTSSGRHIVEIKNQDVSDEEFCDGDDLRFDHLEPFLQHDDFKKHIANADKVPVIVAGDFNCVSHLDHTVVTQHSGLNQSRILPTQVSKAMYQAGFSDTFREANPDVLKSTLGHTWTTVGMGYVYQQGKGFVPVDENPEPEYRDPYARIDFIYAMGPRLETKSSRVIAHHSSQSARSFPEFPSDHAAVISEFRVRKK